MSTATEAEAEAEAEAGPRPYETLIPPFAEFERLRSDLAEVTTQRDAAQVQFSTLNTRLIGLESELQQHRAELVESREKIATIAPLGVRLTRVRGERDELRTLLTGVQNELTEAHQKASAHEPVATELAGLRVEHDQLRSLLTNVQSELDVARSHVAAAELLGAELEALRAGRDELHAQLVGVQNALTEARERTSTLEPAVIELDSLRVEHDELRMLLTGLQTELDTTRQQASTTGPLNAELDALRSERDELRSLLAGVQNELTQSRECTSALEPLTAELDGLRVEHEKLRSLLAAAQAELDTTRFQASSAEPLGTELNALRAEHDKLRTLLAGVQNELMSTREQANTFGPVGDQLAALRLQHDELRDVANEAIERSSWQAERIQSLTRALENGRVEIDRLKDENLSSAEELKNLRYRVGKQSTLETERDSLADEVYSLRQERDQAMARLDVAGGDRAPASNDAEVARLTAERDDALQRIRDMETETFQGFLQPIKTSQQVDPQVAALQKKLNDLEGERNELTLRLGAAEADREALLFSVTDRNLTSNVDKAGSKGDSELVETRAKLDAQTQKVAALQIDLQAAYKRIEELNGPPDTTEVGPNDPQSLVRKSEEKQFK